MSNQRQYPSPHVTSVKASSLPKSILLLVGLAVASALMTGSASAQQSSTGEPTTFTEKVNSMNWRMPSFRLPNFLVRHDEQDRIVERKNGLVSDIKGTASRSWQRTKETFNPARLNPMNMFAGPATDPQAEKKPGFFSSLLSPAKPEPQERIATVNDWLEQERP